MAVPTPKVLMARRTRLCGDSPLPAEQLMNVFPAGPLSWPPLLVFDGAIIVVAVAVGVAVAVIVGVRVVVAVPVVVAVAVAVVVALRVAVAVGVAVEVSVAVVVAVAVAVGVAGSDPIADPASLTVAEDFPVVASLVIVIVAVNFVFRLLSGEN
jgi:hypothetical protein